MKKANIINNNNTVTKVGEKYYIENQIDQGAYGMVFRGKNTITGEYIALKKIEIDN